MDKINYTNMQKWVILKLITGIVDKNIKQQTLGGYAGTGKTTIIKALTKYFPNYAVAAFTGKAANVLRKKGIEATTIHSRIYEPVIYDGQVYFELRAEPDWDGFIIDESSMVSKDIYDDIVSFNMPMIFVGDHGQLEPVGSDFNLMSNPDYTLEEIHRNAGDIALFAETLRKGFPSRTFRPRDGSVNLMNKFHVSDQLLSSVDQIICAFNKTRVDTNNRVREILGRTSLIEEGERIMCLKNVKKLGLFNGMQGIVKRIYTKKGKNVIDFEFDGMFFTEIPFDLDQFGKEKYDFNFKSPLVPFDYAYCITAHKSQGDEWGSVLALEQKCNRWEHKRWAYTVASRAKNNLYWVLSN